MHGLGRLELQAIRYGGEEFLLCMPGLDLAAACSLTERLREGVANRPIQLEQASIRCRVSCGVARLEGDLPVEKSIERADQALYQAKFAGRNRTHVYEALPDCEPVRAG